MEPTTQRTFHIRACLGRGGFGEVFRATMASASGLRSDVAVKVLRSDVDLRGDAVKRLRDEGRLLASLNHPAILRVLDFAALEGRVALVTEYVPGEDLTPIIEAGDLDGRALLEIIAVVADALHVAYDHTSEDGTPLRLVHRDIKPSNIRVSRHGQVRVLDFGIAWSEDASREAKTADNSTVGSLPYMAPERFGRHAAASAADVYALGCTLYEGLTGERLFPDSTPLEMVRMAANAADHDGFVMERLTYIPDAVTQPVRALLRDMLAHQPEDRPTAREVSIRAEELAEDLPGRRLKAWARQRAWPDPSAFTSNWLEQTFVDGTTSGHQFVTSSAAPAASATGATSEDTFFFQPPVDGDDGHGDSDTVERPTMHPDSIEEDFPVDTAFLEPPAAQSPGSAPGYDTADSLHGAPPSPETTQADRALPVLGLVVAAVVLLLGGAALGIAVLSTGEGPKSQDAVPTEVVSTLPPGTNTEAPNTEAPNTEAAEAVEDTETPPSEPVEAAPAEAPPPTAPVAAPPLRVKPKTPTTVAELTPIEAPPAEKEPAPAPVAPGTVLAFDATATLQLRAGKTVHSPGKLPPGSYEVYADFGTGEWSPVTRVEVLSGATITVRCNSLTFACETK